LLCVVSLSFRVLFQTMGFEDVETLNAIENYRIKLLLAKKNYKDVKFDDISIFVFFPTKEITLFETKRRMRTGYRAETAFMDGKRTNTFIDIILTYPFCSAIYKGNLKKVDGNDELIYLAPSKLEQKLILNQKRTYPILFLTAYEPLEIPYPREKAKDDWKKTFDKSEVIYILKDLKSHLKFDQKKNQITFDQNCEQTEFQLHEVDTLKLSKIIKIKSKRQTFVVLQHFDIENLKIYFYEHSKDSQNFFEVVISQFLEKQSNFE
jgi:hypothetical protein